jgi:DNA-binding NarL/FixJ family response regulator
VVVLDISMPGGNGLELLEEIKRTNPALPVLVLSMYPPDQYARRILEAGAAGYLPKERASEELVDAIRHIHAGGIYISRRPIPAGSDGEVTHHSLSEREYTIMLSLAAGRTVPQIAKSHRLSLGTVERSRKSIFAKMRLRSNADLTRYAIRHRLGLV